MVFFSIHFLHFYFEFFARTMQLLLDSLTPDERANADLEDGDDEEEEEVFEGY